MRKLLTRGLCLVLLVTPVLIGLLRGEQPETAPADPTLLLIRQLGSPQFAARQEASKRLVALGEDAIPALRQAATTGNDPEIRRRAREVMLEILPATRKSKTTGLELVLINAGEVYMGSPIHEKGRRTDETLHSVRISEPFYIGILEVTQDAYQTLMGNNPSWFANAGGGADKVRGIGTTSFPVEQVTWFDALEFCNRLSKKDGFPSYYKLTDVERDKDMIRNAKVAILAGNGYRLPTEAEWELACRGSSDRPFHFGWAPTGRELNCRSSIVAGGYGSGPLWQPLDRTNNVGSYPANDRKIHDMHGNVGEWCWDVYDKDYHTFVPALDPQGPKTGTHRVVRGGSWLVTEVSCRSASRMMQSPGERFYTVGFRVVRNP